MECFGKKDAACGVFLSAREQSSRSAKNRSLYSVKSPIPDRTKINGINGN